MSFLDAGKVCLFSGISGVITLNGEPVSGAKLTRTVNLNKDKSDHATTDKSGYFEMPPVFQRSASSLLPQEFVVSQEIEVLYEGMKYDIWSGIKRKPEENVEARGDKLHVTCELTSKKTLKEVERSPYMTRCTWPAEADVTNTGF